MMDFSMSVTSLHHTIIQTSSINSWQTKWCALRTDEYATSLPLGAHQVPDLSSRANNCPSWTSRQSSSFTSPSYVSIFTMIQTWREKFRLFKLKTCNQQIQTTPPITVCLVVQMSSNLVPQPVKPILSKRETSTKYCSSSEIWNHSVFNWKTTNLNSSCRSWNLKSWYNCSPRYSLNAR